MPMLFIHLHNAELCSRDDGDDYETPEAALAFGVQSAMDVASEEVRHGHGSASVVIHVEKADGTRMLSSVVSVSLSPLMVVQPNARESA